MGVKSSALLPAAPAGLHWAPWERAVAGVGVRGLQGLRRAVSGRALQLHTEGGALSRFRSEAVTGELRVRVGRAHASDHVYFLAY